MRAPRQTKLLSEIKAHYVRCGTRLPSYCAAWEEFLSLSFGEQVKERERFRRSGAAASIIKIKIYTPSRFPLKCD
jgi:hypothetical protein